MSFSGRYLMSNCLQGTARTLPRETAVKHWKSMSIYKLLFALTLSFVPLLAQALNTSITLIADSSITPSSGELVTFGLPLARGDVFNTDDIHVASGSTELKISVQEGLRWHWL